PAVERTLNATVPAPRQRSPTMSKRPGELASVRVPFDGTSRNPTAASPPDAAAGAMSARRTTQQARSDFKTDHQGAASGLPSQGIRRDPDRILTLVRVPPLRGFSLSLGVAAGALALLAPATAAPPRVLVVAFDNDVN